MKIPALQDLVLQVKKVVIFRMQSREKVVIIIHILPYGNMMLQIIGTYAVSVERKLQVQKQHIQQVIGSLKPLLQKRRRESGIRNVLYADIRLRRKKSLSFQRMTAIS